jgi:hypothetical protein
MATTEEATAAAPAGLGETVAQQTTTTPGRGQQQQQQQQQRNQSGRGGGRTGGGNPRGGGRASSNTPGRGRGRGPNNNNNNAVVNKIAPTTGIPFGHVPAYLPGSSSLVEELDCQILVVLRDGRHIIGVSVLWIFFIFFYFRFYFLSYCQI